MSGALRTEVAGRVWELGRRREVWTWHRGGRRRRGRARWWARDGGWRRGRADEGGAAVGGNRSLSGKLCEWTCRRGGVVAMALAEEVVIHGHLTVLTDEAGEMTVGEIATT